MPAPTQEEVASSTGDTAAHRSPPQGGHVEARPDRMSGRILPPPQSSFRLYSVPIKCIRHPPREQGVVVERSPALSDTPIAQEFVRTFVFTTVTLLKAVNA